MTRVMACIDNSQSSLAVCDYAAWASQRLSAPLTLLHVLDKEKYPASADLSGNIGLGSLSLIHISEPTRLRRISYAVFCLKKLASEQFTLAPCHLI